MYSNLGPLSYSPRPQDEMSLRGHGPSTTEPAGSCLICAYGETERNVSSLLGKLFERSLSNFTFLSRTHAIPVCCSKLCEAQLMAFKFEIRL